jgi:hypothetical protein
MNGAAAGVGLLLFTSIGLAQQATSPEALRAEVQALKPAHHVWRAIAWKTCPLEALQASREQKKPVLVWVFLGLPADERC